MSRLGLVSFVPGPEPIVSAHRQDPLAFDSGFCAASQRFEPSSVLKYVPHHRLIQFGAALSYHEEKRYVICYFSWMFDILEGFHRLPTC